MTWFLIEQLRYFQLLSTLAHGIGPLRAVSSLRGFTFSSCPCSQMDHGVLLSRDMRLERPLNCSLFTCMGFVLRFLQAFELSECRYLYPLRTCLNTTKSTPRRAMINHHPQEAYYRPRSILVAATRSRIACPMPIRKKP